MIKKLFLIFFVFALFLNSCGIYKRSDVKDNPTDVNERVRRNIEEGKGIRFGNLGSAAGGGVFDFASSNEMWRASIEILDFVSFTNASYSGGILITDWFSNSKESNNKEIKITVRFLSNEIRAEGIDVTIHERICDESKINCRIIKKKSKLESEIKLAILKKAARIQDEDTKKIRKKNKKKKINVRTDRAPDRSTKKK
tara:strand:+ start:684 stop:1277 length:594 start_codon:yes stop_codon:yes gene_type:complete